MSATAFALLLWGAVLAVFLMFAFELYAIADEYGWLA